MAEKIVKDSQGLAKDLVNDCISRKAAIDAICRDGVRLERGGALMITISTAKQWAVDLLCDLPSAQPERKRGRWEYVDYGGFGNWHCTVCGKICICNGDFDFCPNCGADMREVDDERPD